MHKNTLLKKGLIVGIIVLFIGVGVHPAFANEVSITAKVDSEDDCNCQPVSNLHLITLERVSNRLDRLLDRLEVYTGIISVLYRNNHEVTDEFKELSNRIITLRESNYDLKSVFEFGLHDVICDTLDSIMNLLIAYADYLEYLMEEYPALMPILYPIRLTIDIVNMQLFFLWLFLFCYEMP